MITEPIHDMEADLLNAEMRTEQCDELGEHEEAQEWRQRAHDLRERYESKLRAGGGGAEQAGDGNAETRSRAASPTAEVSH